MIIENEITRKGIAILLILALIILGLFSFPKTAYAEKVVLSEQTYYHLDMGIQLAYNEGSSWGSDNIYGSGTIISVNTSVNFNNDLEVLDTYPLHSTKGSSFDFNGTTSSHNIPRALGDSSWAFNFYYKDFTSILLTEGSCNSNGRSVSFDYTANLSTSIPLEVVEYGEDGRDNDIYQLFGGKAALENNQPRIAEAIALALRAGAEGTAGDNKLYLIFCPNVIEYKKYVTIGDLEAQLSLPTSAKQGASYTVSDTSVVDSSLTVEEALLERHYGDGNWETVVSWPGGEPGKNSGGSIDESCDKIDAVTYRLTVTATNGQADTDIKTIEITDGRNIEAVAILSLPEYTYEGHPALAVDQSEFKVNGIDYSARRAYEEGVAANSFYPLPAGMGVATKESKTTANVVFPVKGYYQVKLQVNTVDRKNLSDAKPIEVRKTPFIIDRLGGYQKENRKQLLNISVATHPGKPIVDYYIELKDMKTGGTLKLTKGQPQASNATIKTRAHTTAGDEYWTNYNLEFLTKNTTAQEYQYTVYMKDSKGDTSTVRKNFTVAPDLPPVAKITIKDTFIRNQGTNIAKIITEDGSTTDGDQLERRWFAGGANLQTKDGFEDISFGSGQQVKYNKTGVGKETIRLEVRDIWIEPTLEEFITDQDRKSASAVAVTEVVNIAPTVRVEPKDAKEADLILMISKKDRAAVESVANTLKGMLIESGIDANLQIIPRADPNSNGYLNSGSYTWKAAINDQSQSSTGLVYDTEYAYVIEAAGFQMIGSQETAIPPYTIKALKTDGTKMNTAWSYTISESTNFSLMLDNSETYVYIACKDRGKTILLNRNNGAYVTTLNVLIPGNPFTTSKNSNLYFLSDNSIQKYDTSTKTMKTVLNKGGILGRIQNGKLTFVGKEDTHKYYIGQFSMSAETFSQLSIPELQEYNYDAPGGLKSGLTPTDMDAAGKVTFTQTLQDHNKDAVGIVLWLADSVAQRVYHLGKVESTYDLKANSVGFVKDETGKAVYMYHSYSDDNSTATTTKRYFKLSVYTLGQGDVLPVKRTIYNQMNNRNNYTGIIYAKYHSQENAIYLAQGSAFQSNEWGGNQQGVQCKIQLPGWTADFNQYGWGWDMAEEAAGYNDHRMLTYNNYESWTGSERRVKMFNNSITKEQAESSAIFIHADFTEGAVRYIEKDFTGNIQKLIEDFKSSLKKATALKLDISDKGKTTISRSFKLKPGETYYYEYEVKRPSGITPSGIQLAAPDLTFNISNSYTGSGNLGSYYVKQVISEDFNDSNLNPFFTLTEGIINGGMTTPEQVKGSSYRYIQSNATINFTIPAGKKAIVIMDVKVNMGDAAEAAGNGWRSGAYINGQRYEKVKGSEHNAKNYTYPYILQAGANTISARCYWYGYGNTGYYTSIDNLKILILDENPAPLANSFSVSKNDDGWTTVKGSFRTPQEIIDYKSQAVTYYPNWPPDLSISSDGYYENYYDFTIPTGMIGKIYATFNGQTSRSNSRIGPYLLGSAVFEQQGTGSYAHQWVQAGERCYVGEYAGANSFVANSGSQRTAVFQRLDTYIYPSNQNGKTNYFINNEKNRIYSPANIFDGNTNFKVNLNSDGADRELMLQNLKIYYMNKGGKVYLYNKPLKEASELSGWTVSPNATAHMVTDTEEEKAEDAPIVYKKGELVAYNLFYNDYENDPSKRQYWKYSHMPYNDGEHPEAALIEDEEGKVIRDYGRILSSSIPRFYVDGRYTVEHWQEDNTNRAGDYSGVTNFNSYDKISNVEKLTFYVEGGATAPWITSIKTIPAAVKEGEFYKIQIGVDDLEKDELRLTTEVYQNKKLIYTHKQSGIKVDASGVYPLTTTGFAPAAEPGVYEVICTVRDWSGAGIGKYKFTVVSLGKITGWVNHTDQWDTNRKKYNLKRFSNEVNRIIPFADYLAMSVPRQRGINVFWSGEKFILLAETEGKPVRVEVLIEEVKDNGELSDTKYSASLSKNGRQSASGGETWTGSLWDNSMINNWGRREPEELNFRFTAYFSDGTTKVHSSRIIVDSQPDFWQLHRLW